MSSSTHVPVFRWIRFADALRPAYASPDLEKNGGAQVHLPAMTSSLHPPQIPPKLLKFQTLTGVSSSTFLLADPSRSRPAPNQGIYKRTVDEESKVKFRYIVSNYVVNISGMLQIVLGAVLTALGAASGPSGAVAVLGALNTVIAGLLTYLKGQGLPKRLEQYLHLLRTLREHIEEIERDLLELDCPLDVDEEIQRISKMYQEVRQSAEDNAPGTVLPPRGVITSLLKKPDINRSDVMAPRGDKTPKDMLTTGLQDLAAFGHHEEEEGKKRMHEGADSGKEAVGHEIGHEKRDIKDEIQHLGSVANETFERLHGEHGDNAVRRSLEKREG